MCDAVRSCDVSASGSADDALKLGTILRGVTAIALYAHPSTIHASGWLHSTARAKTLPPLIAALVQIAEPLSPRPISVTGLDCFTCVGPRAGRTLTELSLLALLHLAIGVSYVEEQLPVALRARIRVPLDAARRRLVFFAGSTHARLGARSVLYLLPPDLAQLIGKEIKLNTT